MILTMLIAIAQQPAVQLPVPSGGGATVIIKEPSSPIRQIQEYAVTTDRLRAGNENISALAGATQTLAGAAVLAETAREHAIANDTDAIRSRWAIQDEAAARRRREHPRWIDQQENHFELSERLGRLRLRETELVHAGLIAPRPASRAIINGIERRKVK